MTPKQALAAAKKKAGSAGKLARALSVTPQAVNHWIKIPIIHVLTVEKLYGISRSDQRPDVYPPA